MLGVNVNPSDPAARPDPARLQQLGLRWVRMVLRDDDATRAYMDACNAAELAVIGLVARESGGYVDGRPAVVQIGNEPDSAGASSWTMSPAEYVATWNLYRDTYPDLAMISAGLASGLPDWWRSVQQLGGLRGCSGLALHPYGKGAADALALADAYQADLPVWFTEWHRPPSEVPHYVAAARAAGVAALVWFSWGGVTGFELDELTCRVLAACR